MQSATFLLVLAITMILGFCHASNSKMYGVVTTVTNTETQVQVAQVDLQTGNIFNFTEIISYYSGSIMEDGLSGFDSMNNIYYFATNDQTGLLYSANVGNKVALPPLDLYVTGFYSISANPSTGEAFVATFTAKPPSSTIFGVTANGEVRTVLIVPATFSTILGGTFDTDKDIFYLSIYYQNQTDQPAIAAIDPTSGVVMSIVMLQCSEASTYVTKLKFDATSGNIYAGGEQIVSGKWTYSYFKINPITGSCTMQSVPSSMGIVTAWAYDLNAGNIWYADATDSGNLLRGVDVSSGTEVASYTTQYILESIEINP